MTMDLPQNKNLVRGLKNRHIQLIALGGTIGTGLFLGSSETIALAGPGILLGYLIGGFFAFLLMRQLGEMLVEEPVAGSVSHFAYKYWSEYTGFITGWNYWILYTLVSMTELSAIAKYVQYWWPTVPLWIPVALSFFIINAINLTAVRMFGEVEFWLAIIKVLAVIAMILFGVYLLISDIHPESSITNLWHHGGFLPNGVSGLFMAMAVVMFAFGGLEMLGFTAAETENPAKILPRATKQVIYRTLLFYVGSLTVLLSLYPWNKISQDSSPFVLVFNVFDSHMVANTLNVIILLAALSVYNSCVYCKSRLLFALAKQENAPKFFANVSAQGTPVNAIIFSGFLTSIAIFVNYFFEHALIYFTSLTVCALMLSWILQTLIHMKFSNAMKQRGILPKFKAPWYPIANYLCLIFLSLILFIIYLSPGIDMVIFFLPIWLMVLTIGYKIKAYFCS